MGKQGPSDYELTARDAASWYEVAVCLRLAAEPILEKLFSIIEEPQTRDGIRLRKLAYTRSYMMLVGCSFENLLKAIAVRRQLIAPGPRFSLDRAVRPNRGGHGLTDLAVRLRLQLSDDEADYLRRLEEYVIWAGRYPVSMKPEDYERSHLERQLTFKTTDPELSRLLFERLSEMVS
jgi:hypothetical protein